MRRIDAFLLAATATLATTGGHAANLSIAGLAVPTMTYTSTAAITAALTSAYNGVGTIFVNTVSTGPTNGFLCTASLINPARC